MLKEKYRFSVEVLQNIIEKQLTLYQYFDNLYQILKSINNNDNDCKLTRQISICSNSTNNGSMKFSQAEGSCCGESSQCDEQGYEYSMIEQVLDSKQFIAKLYPNVNSLLTTTNIGIAKQTLRIYMIMDTNIDRKRAINRIKETINILTLYQIQKGINCIICGLQELNKIFNNIGLIITKDQYQFYYHQFWNQIPQEITVRESLYLFGRKQVRKILQVYDLLALSIQMEEIRVIKNNFREWLNSDDYHKKTKTSNKKKDKKQTNILTKQLQHQQKPIIEQNPNITKLKIQKMTSFQLIQQLIIKQYNISQHYKKYTQYRKHLLYFYDKQQYTKKIYTTPHEKRQDNTITSILKNENTSTHKYTTNNKLIKFNSINTPISSKIKNNILTGDARRQMQSKIEQKVFNLKLINGYYFRQQILEDIRDNKVQVVEDWEDQVSNGQSQASLLNTKQRVSILSKNSKFNDYVEQEVGKQNNKLIQKYPSPVINPKIQKTKQQQKIPIKAPNKAISIQQNSQKKNRNKNKISSNYLSSQVSILDRTYLSPKIQNYKESIMERVQAQGFFNLGFKIMNK